MLGRTTGIRALSFRSLNPRRITSSTALAIALLVAPGCDPGPPAPPKVAPSAAASDTSVPRGGTLRIAGSSDVDYMDPAGMYGYVSWFLARGVVRTLVTLPAGGDSTTQVVPDLATDTGTPNEDLTELSFHLKSGIRFGPELGGDEVPGVTGTEVVCDDFDYAFERMFLPGVPSAYPFHYSVLEGAPEVERPWERHPPLPDAAVECPDDKTIVFHLDEPVGDWPLRLTMPATGPVPRRWAKGFDRARVSAYDRHMIATGPYHIDEWRPGRQIVLRRNPWWSASTDDVRDANVNEVRWTLGLEHNAAIRVMERGRYHLALDVYPQGPPRRIGLTPPSRLKYREGPAACLSFVFLDRNKPPLDDPLLRRAVAHALDRSHLVRLQGGPAVADIATSVIPPGIPGHLPPDRYDPFPSGGRDALQTVGQGDVKVARALMRQAGYPRGYPGTLRISGTEAAPYAAMADAIKSDLTAIGFKNVGVMLPPPRVHASSEPLIPSDKTSLAIGSACADYPDASPLMDIIAADGPTTLFPLGPYAPTASDEIAAAIEKARALELGPGRTAAWELVNEALTQDATLIPWSWRKSTAIHAPSLVNVVYNPFFRNVDWVVAGVRRP